MYHPEIEKLDREANKLYGEGKTKETTQLHLKAGALQQRLIRPIGKRYLSPQWVWSYGHIGLLHMLIKWFRKTEPETKLILETQGSVSNQYFLKALEPFLTIIDRLPIELEREAQDNAVYFACPDGEISIHNFYKKVAQKCPEIILTEPDVTDLLKQLNMTKPYTAIHARNFSYDPARNVTLEIVEKMIGDEINVISIGLDEHPINDIIPSVLKLPNPWLASFQLSAACNKFIGCNSGPWVVANAYGKHVELVNDHLHKAWIYPEEIEE